MTSEDAKMFEDAFKILGADSNITPAILLQLLHHQSRLTILYTIARLGMGRTPEQMQGIAQTVFDATWNNPEWMGNFVVATIEDARRLQKEAKANV